MRRRGACALIVLALAATLTAEPAAVKLETATSGLRRLAASPDPIECPRAALYIIPALPNVKDAAVFQLVRSTYIATVKSLAPAGAISDVIPTLTEPNTVKGGISVHTTILFSGSCEAGKAAARTLHVKLLGDVRPMFYVPAPRAKSLFGDVYMITVSHPYLADGTGAKLVAPSAPAGTNLAAQFSITWEDIPPSKIGELQAAAFKAAILKQLPAGAGVYFTTMITEGVSYRFGNHWRACAAPVSPTVAKSSGKTSQGGEVWPPGQPADVKRGRLVFNTNVHGTVFNTAAGKVILSKFMEVLRFNTAAVFPPRTFGRMALEPGYGLRLVNDPSYPCTCELPPPPTLTLAQAFGPTSATATATGAANVTWARWQFTATPSSGAAISQESDTPLVWWYNLAANTPYTISVVGITRAGKRVQGANTLAIKTPQEGAPTVAAATATSATTATVRLNPPTNGQTVSQYIVALCLKAQPTTCVKQSSVSIQLYFTGLTPGALYVVSATAKIGSTTVPASNKLPLAMPQRGAPILLTAVPTTALTGAATAVAPNGASFSKYVFTAVSPGGAPTATSTVANPLTGRFTGLRPATQYDVSVVGYTGSKASPPSNTLSFVTPAANAPLNTGTPKSPFIVVIKLVPPTIPPLNGGSWVRYDVTLCPIAGPQTACVSQRTGGSGRRLLSTPADIAIFEGRTPFTTYNFVSNAISESGEISKEAMVSQVTTPGAFPWSVSVVPDSVTQSSASIKITPPSEGGPFAKYVLSVCTKPRSGAPNWDACPQTTCSPSQVAGCPVSGLNSNTAYVVSGVAFTADGVATIRSAAAAFSTLPWPAPTIDSVVVGLVDLSTAVATIVGPTLAPPGGYSLYNLTVCATNPVGGCAYQSCTPVRAAPATTTCTLTGLSQNTTYRVLARAVQGSLTSERSNFPYFRTKLQDPATLVSVQALSYDSGIACVTAPTLGGPWNGGFQCQSCYKGVCKDAPKCTLNPTRRLLAPACQGSVACELGTLESSTGYTVTCVALSTTAPPSPVSNSLVLTTEPAPAPPVTTSTTNPVMLRCTPPGGGPWATCQIQLCEQQGPTRRRQLRGDGGCTPINLSCPFVNGVATCDVTGKVRQETIYDITSTAVKADGVRKSTTGPQGTYNLPYFPKPTVTAANVVGTDTYNVTIVPVASPALKAYPIGGWTYYIILAQMGSPPTNQPFSCKAKNSAGGVPQPVTCQVTLATSNLPASFGAQAVQGNENTPKGTDLRSDGADFFTPTTILAAGPLSVTVGSVCVTPPTSGGPFTKFLCTPCYKGACKPATTCTEPTRRRQLLAPVNPCNSHPGSQTCYLNNLESTTLYDVTCVAQTAAGVSSPSSNRKSFTTYQAAPPAVTSPKYNPVILECTAPSGGPWQTCQLSLCKQELTRRRSLLEPAGCIPFTLTCPFNQTTGVAACDVTGKVQQDVWYQINSTAIKADGTRKSQTGTQPDFKLDLYPKPTVTAILVGSNTYNVTIEPVDSVPLVSYPAGGWGNYSISAQSGINFQGFICKAKNNGAGVPQAVTCQVTVAFSDLPIAFTATAYQFDAGSPPDEDLRSAESDPYTPIRIVSAQSSNYNLGTVCLMPPSAGGPWTGGINCTACYNGTCLAPQDCGTERRRRQLLFSSSCDAYPGTTECFLDTLESTTPYTVTCTAKSSVGVSSGPSNTGSFTTTQAPAPPVAYPSSNPTIITCTAPGGGPWANCQLDLCKQVIGRRRLQSGCSPVTATCAFNQTSGLADCDLGGAVELAQYYVVNSTAIKADGTRKSQTGTQPTQYTLPFYPVLTLSNLVTVTPNTTFNVTITPNITTPLVSYPSGGWDSYEIMPQVGGLGQGTTTCTAVNVGGVPQAVVCTFSVITAPNPPTTTLRVSATAVKSMLPKPWPLKTTVSGWLNADAR
ncbi:fibronectin isoform X1 [Chlorella sorokiniana]|uniref:Fibronectin isoform X1 n=1 Tax=Chlorella sorokiniana TaxID=3076 RepID=A0A2P6TKT5_CHLSO|nr:fibronectin isoform X1 [Chlorella sorokiniana]|eukprot:PRW44907.1 fibronectin isoform X1 [Chlorella sorokiniana]